MSFEGLDTDACLSRHWDDLIRRHKQEYGPGANSAYKELKSAEDSGLGDMC